jgi:hypothetical protein
MSEQSQQAMRDRDLISGLISGALAAIVMSYVANVAQPGILHAVLALASVGATVVAYLYIARAKVDAPFKAGAIIAIGVVSALYLILLSMALR